VVNRSPKEALMTKIRLPGPATVLAAAALFVALSGTAVAAGIVAKAKFAANAGKLQNNTAAQVAAMPSPASTAAGLVTVKTAAFSVGASDGKTGTATCDGGQKALAGGFTSSGTVLAADTAPTGDGSGWQVLLLNIGDQAASGTVYAVCLK
jgi:hypothetical protein